MSRAELLLLDFCCLPAGRQGFSRISSEYIPGYRQAGVKSVRPKLIDRETSADFLKTIAKTLN
jgi:hypothetical protein